MNNSAIYDRFIEMFLESSDDYEPYGVISPRAARPQQVERSWCGDTEQAEPATTGSPETDD